jgi:hypothetical protein
MNFTDKDFIAKLAGFQIKEKEPKKDACAQFMDEWRLEKKQSNEPMWTGD